MNAHPMYFAALGLALIGLWGGMAIPGALLILMAAHMKRRKT